MPYDSSPLHGGTTLLNVSEILDKVQVAEGNTVADLGCGGGGHFVIATAQRVGDIGTVYALDVQKRVLDIVRGRAKTEGLNNIQPIWSNLEQYGAAAIPDSVCDSAFIVNVLFQNKDYGTILREAARLLKKGGRLVVIDWKQNDVPLGPPQTLRVSPDKIKTFSAEARLVLVDEFSAGPYHYAVVFGK